MTKSTRIHIVSSPQSMKSCREITAVPACPSLRVPSHTDVPAAISPMHTASMAITLAPMVLIMLRLSNEQHVRKIIYHVSRGSAGRIARVRDCVCRLYLAGPEPKRLQACGVLVVLHRSWRLARHKSLLLCLPGFNRRETVHCLQ